MSIVLPARRHDRCVHDRNGKTGGRMKNGLSGLALAALVTGCVTADPAQIGPFPDNYKAAVAADIRTRFFDPYSLRDVAITMPVPGHLITQQGWIVCVRANGKNRMGAYVGMKTTAFLVNNGHVLGVDDDFQDCSKLHFTPWPEMDSGPKQKT